VEEEEEYDYGNEIAEGDEEEQELGPTVEELIERGQKEQLRLQEMNEMLQKRARMALDLKNKGRPAVNRDLARLDGVTTRYKCVHHSQQALVRQYFCHVQGHLLR
jgi:hypothetical protein